MQFVSDCYSKLYKEDVIGLFKLIDYMCIVIRQYLCITQCYKGFKSFEGSFKWDKFMGDVQAINRFKDVSTLLTLKGLTLIYFSYNVLIRYDST